MTRFLFTCRRMWLLLPPALWLFTGQARAQAQSPLLDDPVFQAFGFADINYVTGDDQTTEGFALGQVVGHAVARNTAESDSGL